MGAELISEDELERRLRASDPVRRDALDDEGIGAALTAVRDAVVSSSAPRPKRPVYRQRWVALGATAVVAAAIVLLVGVGSPGGNAGSGGAARGRAGGGLPLAVSPAAAAQLGRVAHAASVQATPNTKQWEYLKVEYVDIGSAQVGGSIGFESPAAYPTTRYTDTSVAQNWTAPNGVTRQRDTNLSFSFLSRHDRAVYLAHRAAFRADWDGPSMALGVDEDRLFGGNGNRPKPFWMRYPVTPQTLIKLLVAEVPNPPATQAISHLAGSSLDLLFLDLSNILLNSTSASLRSTAYQALAYVPHTQVLGHRTDQLGRAGVAISLPTYEPRESQTLIVSGRTGDLLEQDTTLTKPANGLPAGTVVSRQILLQRRIVNSDTALPGGGRQPFRQKSSS